MFLDNQRIAAVVAHVDDHDWPRDCGGFQLIVGWGQEKSLKARQSPDVSDHLLQLLARVVALINLTCDFCRQIELIPKADVILC